MHRIAITGLSLHDTDLAGVEALGRSLHAPGERRSGLRDLADELGASELICLETCNRIEIAFAREEGALPDAGDVHTLARALAPEGSAQAVRELAERMHFFGERDAVHYLFRIASSLESLVVGEDQILAQVRAAFQAAEREGLAGPLLAPLFRQALQTGKLVRTRTDLSHHPVSIVSIALLELQRRARGLGRESLQGHRALIVGAGKMGRLFVPALADAGVQVIAVSNRSLERARALAREVSGDCLALELADLARVELPQCVDIVVSATGSSEVVLGPGELGRLADRLAARAQGQAPAQDSKLLAVDVAMPRDLDPGSDTRIEVVDIESLRELADQNRAKRQSAALRAAEIVTERTQVYCKRRSDPLVAAALADLHAQTDELVDQELRALLNGKGPGLPEEQALALDKWARRLTGRLNHIASGRLKRLAHELGEFAADSPSPSTTHAEEESV